MTTTHLIPLQTGNVEVLVDDVENAVGVALICHPHPLLGGHAAHKVPFTIARALNHRGYITWRPNFRGVGQSEGLHDEGNGETEDMQALLALMRQEFPQATPVLAGFSFGAHVISRLAARCEAQATPIRQTILCGIPHGMIGTRRYDSPALKNALVIHGQNDLNVPLEQPLAWADACGLTVTVIPATDHFFKGKLPLLSKTIAGSLVD